MLRRIRMHLILSINLLDCIVNSSIRIMQIQYDSREYVIVL